MASPTEIRLGDVASLLQTYAPAATAAAGGNYQAALAQLVTELKLETAYTPPIDLVDPFGPTPPNAPSSVILSLLQPKLTLYVSGQPPVVVAPYGDPGVSQWGGVEIVGIGVAAVIAAFLLF